MTKTTWTPDSLAGWRTFVAYRPERPEVLSTKDRNALTSLLREQYDDARIEFVNAPIVLPTPDLNRLIRETRIVTGLNRGAQFTARQSLALSGSQTLGKSTAALHVGATHEEHQRAKHDREADQGFAPVPCRALGTGTSQVPVARNRELGKCRVPGTALRRRTPRRRLSRRSTTPWHLPSSRRCRRGPARVRVVGRPHDSRADC